MSSSEDQPSVDQSLDNAEIAEQARLAEAQIVEQSKRIEYYLTDYSVELLAMKLDNGQFVIPSYSAR